MNNLVRVPAAGVPETPFRNPSLARLRAAMGRVNGKPMLMTGFELTAHQREEVRRQAERLKARLSPSPNDTERKAAALAGLLTGWRSSGDALQAEVYLEAVAGLPGWSVVEACRKIISGETELDPRWPPTPPQVAQYARMYVAPLQRDVETLEQIASAVGDEEFRRVCDGFEALKSELAGVRKPMEPSNRFVARCEELGINPDDIPDAPKTGSKLEARL